MFNFTPTTATLRLASYTASGSTMTDTSHTNQPPPDTPVSMAASAASTTQPVKAVFMTIPEIMAIADTQVTPEMAVDFQRRRLALRDYCRINRGCDPSEVVSYLGKIKPTHEPDRSLFMHWMTTQDIRQVQTRSK